ncbi:energy-coupling factor ABC transporter permease [Nocardioides sp. Soil805]|uniref:energy-coupling factor ABC transporter permease n=1 Tax=Nocardioides sp. Soil805 TaxID=1736416 RepID=UPI0007039E20|nr:energy-coupling factor ABC transporter permease [Nocardioides sp. Soil805]KRF34656.1 cobalamin biosynthesis protein CbiM [Nocardioides sp. Soil805]
MHVPDGFLDAPTSLATAGVAVAGIAVALRGARRELDDRVAPLAGIIATFVFAGQMINFPVAGGTSGHLMGGALTAVLVGPYTGLLCMTVVLAVQALMFADGGITALGTNVVLMGVVAVVVGYAVFRGALLVLPRRISMVAPAAALGAVVSVAASAATFVLLYSVGGVVPIPFDTLLTAMLGVHVVIGVGEAVITFVVVAGIVTVRPDLVHGARRLVATRELETRLVSA